MVKWLRALFLNHSYHFTTVSGVGSSPTLASCETSKFCLRVRQVFFLGVFSFLTHLLIGMSHLSWNNLERDVKLN